MKVNIMTVSKKTESVEIDELFEIENQKCFAHKVHWTEWSDDIVDMVPVNGWRVSEYRSGYSFGYGDTKEDAIENAKYVIAREGRDKFISAINKTVDRMGLANI